MEYKEILSIFTGAVLGDAYGLTYEYKGYNIEEEGKAGILQNWNKRSGGRYFPHKDEYNKGTYSDDTQLTLGVARSMAFEVEGEDFQYFAKIEMPIWVDYNVWGGKIIKDEGIILGRRYPWDSDEANAYFNADEDGGLMRIMPIVVKYNTDIKKIMRKVHENVMITHGHPKGILGARLYAYYLYLIINKRFNTFEESLNILIKDRNIWGSMLESSKCLDYEHWLALASKYNFKGVWEETVEDIVRLLNYIKDNKLVSSDAENILKELGCYSDEHRWDSDRCALASICLYGKYKGNVVEGIKNIGSSFGVDTDTLASITGSLLGAYSTDWLDENAEWLKYLQNYEYIKSLIKSIYIDGDTMVLLDNSFSICKVRLNLRNKPVGYKVYADPFGYIEIDKEKYCEVYSSSLVCREIYCKTDIGQEISFKYYTRV